MMGFASVVINALKSPFASAEKRKRGRDMGSNQGEPPGLDEGEPSGEAAKRARAEIAATDAAAFARTAAPNGAPRHPTVTRPAHAPRPGPVLFERPRQQQGRGGGAPG
jgi:hypothetical protein